MLALLCPAAAQAPLSVYSNCKYGYEVALPAGASAVALEDGFELRAREKDAEGQLVDGAIRVNAVGNIGQFGLWHSNGRLIRRYHLEVEHGRTRFAGDWERVGGMLVLEWAPTDAQPSGHMAHAQPNRPAEARYAVLRRGDGGQWIVYSFTLTGAAMRMPWMPGSLLRQVLDGFRLLPLDPDECSERKLAQRIGRPLHR